jgi:hypothetical protein
MPTLLLALLAGCSSLAAGSNPLIGRWLIEAPGGAFNLGTAEFRADGMRGLGLDQEVEYVIDGDHVRVIPIGFGPQLEATIVDRDTVRLGSPLTGAIVTLRRRL